jgi:hypothetical protein
VISYELFDPEAALISDDLAVGNKPVTDNTSLIGFAHIWQLKNAPCGLTPELSRTAQRLGDVVHDTALAEPRSGLGLND